MGDAQEVTRDRPFAGPIAWRPIVAVSLGATLFTALQGLTYPLLSLLLDRRGVAEGLIGLNAAMMPVGMIVAAPLASHLIRRMGPLALICASIVGAVLSLLLVGAIANVWVWMPLRFLTGACLSWVFIVADTWVNELALERVRGRVLGLYSMLGSLGFALGPLLLARLGTGGWVPFIAGGACGLAALLPLLASRHELPPRPAAGRDTEAGGGMLAFARAAPLLVAGTAASALADQVAMSLLPIFCLRYGLDVRTASLMLVSMVLGSMMLQYPAGWLADRFSTRALYIGCALLTAASALMLPLAARSPPLLGALVFVWGGAYYAIFTLALVMLGRLFRGHALIAGNAAFAATWGLGGLIGAPLAGAAMQRLGPHGLTDTLAAVFVALALAVALVRSDAPRAG